MNTKTCTKCNARKEIEEFGVHARGLLGRRSNCKACVRNYNKSYHAIRYSEDEDYRTKLAANAAKWSKNNPIARAAIAKKRNAKAAIADKMKVSARALVNQRVRFGRMPRASECECSHCGEQAAHYHHHKGYNFDHRYDVVPVCHKCHRILG